MNKSSLILTLIHWENTFLSQNNYGATEVQEILWKRVQLNFLTCILKYIRLFPATYHNNIWFWSDIIIESNHPLSMNRPYNSDSDIDFNLMRSLPSFNLFRNFMRIPLLAFIFQKVLAWFVNRDINKLEIICPIIWNCYHFTLW